MSDLISRQDVLHELDGCDYELKDWQRWKLKTMVRDIPSVQPERKKGHWIDAVIPNDSGGFPVIVCDKCNTFFPLQFGDGHNFCPNCGAKMEESDGKEDLAATAL